MTMKKTILIRTFVATGLAMAPVAIASSAQALSYVSTQVTGEKSTSSIIGLNVENQAGEKLGDISYLVLDSSGKISTVVIGVGGFLGVGAKNVGVAYSDLKFTTDKDGKAIAVIDATKDSLSSAPKYVWTEKSTMQKLKEDAAELTAKAKDAAGMNKTDPSH